MLTTTMSISKKTEQLRQRNLHNLVMVLQFEDRFIALIVKSSRYGNFHSSQIFFTCDDVLIINILRALRARCPAS